MERKLCFIVDVQGNYYKLNEKQELVVARNEKDALVLFKEEADKRIEGVRKSRFYKTVEVKENDESKETELEDKTDRQKKSLVRLENDWTKLISVLSDMSKHIDEYSQSLNSKLSDVDKEKTDIDHYIEFYEGNPNEIINIVSLLKDCMRRRREIKNEISRVRIMKETIFSKKCSSQIDIAYKRMKKLEEHKYTPRKLHSLFEGCSYTS